jgi:hypothetical protein
MNSNDNVDDEDEYEDVNAIVAVDVASPSLILMPLQFMMQMMM